MREDLAVTPPSALPVAVIGAGPIGLAAAAHLHARDLPFVVLEAGPHVGASVRDWGHVRLFSPWSYVVDDLAAALLEPTGWVRPDGTAYPRGAELVAHYLQPLAAHRAIAPHLRLGARVTAVARRGADKLRSAGRDALPFELVLDTAAGEQRILARAVVDASGTWTSPNPLGPGVPAAGERLATAAGVVQHRIPDALGADREDHAGRATLVVGAGHSAFNAVLDLAALAEQVPGTQVVWAVRRETLGGLFGGGEADALAARGLLGDRVRALVDRGTVALVRGFRATAVDVAADGRAVVRGERVDGTPADPIGPVDRIVALTGFRPDLDVHRELRLAIDPVVETTPALAPLIDPNLHSCGTVRPHGAAELAHPEADLYVVGMKSYGRAPTFLLLTGYEQVRSVVAAIAGDHDAAADVRLELPETGVCSTAALLETPAAGPAAACCG
jgi:hypothetical protein